MVLSQLSDMESLLLKRISINTLKPLFFPFYKLFSAPTYSFSLSFDLFPIIVL